jgi:hypothetical protein
MMNRKGILIGAILAFVFSSSGVMAWDDSFGRMTGGLATADACGSGIGLLGGFIGLGDDATSLFGVYTYGFSKYTEGRIKFGFSDPEDTPHYDSDPRLMIGGDLKYEIMDYYNHSAKNPFDLALGGSMEFVDTEGGSAFLLGGNLIGSIPYRFNSGNRLVPYMIINFRMERISNGDADTDFEAGANLGVKFEFSDDLGLFGEFQIDGNDAFFTGLEVRVF